MNKINVFISYAHEDSHFKDELQNHLKILERKGVIDIWSDRSIQPGSYWSEEIEKHITEANIILLLISSDFLASEYCYEKELSIALNMHDNGKGIVIPIIVRSCLWEESVISKLQTLPSEGKPVQDWPDKDRVWLDVTKGIAEIIELYSKKLNQREFINSLDKVLKTIQDMANTPIRDIR